MHVDLFRDCRCQLVLQREHIARVTLESDVVIGQRVLIHPGAVIGADGARSVVARHLNGALADRYGGAIVRPAQLAILHASRRKAVTLRFAKVAAERLALALDLATEPRLSTGAAAE